MMEKHNHIIDFIDSLSKRIKALSTMSVRNLLPDKLIAIIIDVLEIQE